jgi:DNA-binding HxlR family transcriptional regulator
MALLDLLGHRWTLRVMWELRDGPLTFRQLRERCDGMSPSVLNDRLAELREARIVDHGDGAGYSLTTEGHELTAQLVEFDAWAERWAAGRRESALGGQRDGDGDHHDARHAHNDL